MPGRAPHRASWPTIAVLGLSLLAGCAQRLDALTGERNVGCGGPDDASYRFATYDDCMADAERLGPARLARAEGVLRRWMDRRYGGPALLTAAGLRDLASAMGGRCPDPAIGAPWRCQLRIRADGPPHDKLFGPTYRDITVLLTARPMGGAWRIDPPRVWPGRPEATERAGAAG